MLAVALCDSNPMKLKLKKRLYDGMSMQQLETPGEPNIDYVMAYLERELAEDELPELDKAWSNFDTFKRESSMKIGDFVSEFDARWRQAEAAGVGDPGPKVRALMLLNRANPTREQRNNVTAHCEGLQDGEGEIFYKKICKPLKTQLSEAVDSGRWIGLDPWLSRR